MLCRVHGSRLEVNDGVVLLERSLMIQASTQQPLHLLSKAVWWKYILRRMMGQDDYVANRLPVLLDGIITRCLPWIKGQLTWARPLIVAGKQASMAAVPTRVQMVRVSTAFQEHGTVRTSLQ